MPAKRKQRKVRRARRAKAPQVIIVRSQDGKGIFKKIGKAFKKSAPKVGRFIKKHKVVSRGLKAVGTATGRPTLIAAGSAAGQLGFGSSNVRYAQTAPKSAKSGMAF